MSPRSDYDDDNEPLDTERVAEFITQLTGVPTRGKTVQNSRAKGEGWEPGDWKGFGRTATTTRGAVRRYVEKRQQPEPPRRINARLRKELSSPTA